MLRHPDNILHIQWKSNTHSILVVCLLEIFSCLSMVQKNTLLASVVTTSSQPFYLYSQQIFCLLIMLFNTGTTDFSSFSSIFLRHCGHVLFLIIHGLTHDVQKTCLHGDSTGSCNTTVHMQHIYSESTSPGKRLVSQPIICFGVYPSIT